MMPVTVALTGGSGFIGGQIARMLVAHGVTVRALSRTQSGLDNGILWIKGSLEDTGSLAHLVAGARIVIHCGGSVRGRDARSFRISNAVGSRQVAEAASNAGTCERFLLMSSLAARHPDLSWYAKSKYDAEQEVIRVAGAMCVTIFRPTAVYGPGDRELRPLFSWLLKGLQIKLGPSDMHLSFVHVFDLVAAVAHWLGSPSSKSAVYEISDGTLGGYSWNGMAKIATDIRTAPVRSLAVPLSFLRAIARLNLLLSYAVRVPPMLTMSKVNELTHVDWTCSNTPFTSATGWVPQIKLRRALREGLF